MASPGQTPQNVLAVFKEEYEQGCQNDYNAATPALAVLSRSGTKLSTTAREHFFALKTRRGQSFRVYGDDDPYTFDTCASPPDYDRVCLTYNVSYTPYTFTNLLQHQTFTMFDVIAKDMEDMQEQNASNMERIFLTGDGRNVYFALSGAETDAGGGNWSYGIKWYGGRQGEDIGQILEALTICGLDIQVAAACGVAPRTTTNPDNDNTVQIVGINDDFGNETIRVDGRINGFLAGDVVYAARRDNAGIQGCTDGQWGLPALMDDFSEVGSFQCLTADNCETFKGHIMDAGGTALTTTMLSKAVSIIRVRAPRGRMDKANFKKHVFWAHPFQTREFADQLQAIRQLNAPALWTEKGIKPFFGVEIDALAFDGIPWIESQVAFRNTVFLGDTTQIIQIHNGPAEGQMMKSPDGNNWVNIGCSPRFQCSWFILNNFGIRSRKSSVQIKGLTSWDETDI